MSERIWTGGAYKKKRDKMQKLYNAKRAGGGGHHLWWIAVGRRRFGGRARADDVMYVRGV